MVFVIGGSASGAKEYAVRYYVEQLQAQGWNIMMDVSLRNLPAVQWKKEILFCILQEIL